MSTQTKCPRCSHIFDVEDALSAELEKKIRLEFEQQQQHSLNELSTLKNKLEADQKSFEEKRRKENEIFQQRLQQEKQKLETELQQTIRRSVAQDFENQLKLLKQSDDEKEEKLRLARQRELEILQREQQLKSKEAELEIAVQKKLLDEREKLSVQLRMEEQEKLKVKEQEFQLKLKEKELQLTEQHKLIEEMKRRSEQGSMQRQGEAQEMLLEELLRDHFPYDIIAEVGKGIEGADCIQTVRNRAGTDCGQIIFESKRTKTFQAAWIDKLKTDMRNTRADVAILVTQSYPKDMSCFGEKDGIWICSFTEVIALTAAMRHTIISVADTRKSEENKGEKMQLLYGYLTGHEFRQQIENIVESFVALKNSITKERIQMEKNWKEREKQLEKVLLSTSGMYGSIKGIAGAGIGSIPLLDNDDEPLLLD